MFDAFNLYLGLEVCFCSRERYISCFVIPDEILTIRVFSLD